jgi:PAS domain S-box-containing protein
MAVQHDLTERRRAEEELRKSEQRFSLAFHASPIPTIISDIETGRMLDVNEQFLRILSYSREEVIGKTSLELGIFVDRGDRDRAQARVRETRAIHDEVIRIRTRSGEIREVVGSVVPIELSGVKCALWTFLDITERRQVERRMQERTAFLDALVEHSPLGILVLDPEHRVRIANPAFVSLFGYSTEDLKGRNPDDLIAPGDDAFRAEAAAFTLEGLAGRPVHAVTARRRKDGALVEVELYGVPLVVNGRLIGVYAIYQDLSERRHLEQQLIQAQKMEAVGQLAGGVAHDFNNLLTAILGYTDLLAGRLKPGSVESEDLDEIRKAGERAASLTRQLLAFSRQQVLERKVLNVNDLIADLEKMLGRLIGEDVTLATVLDPALRRVRADAGQVEQVIMNLAVNARDAMPRGGRMTIETANVELDEAYASQHATVRPGSYVMFAVSDNGAGMDAETLSRMFEPFFTTKGQGKGTGLGLATVYGIVKQSGGYIWAYSEVGKGTTFKIYLPRVEEGSDAEPVPAAEPVSLVGSETVLLVEDEKSVRTLSRSILETYGYTVLEAGSGKEGLDVARDYPQPIHLLLSDIVMPEMGGLDLASRLEVLRPGLRVLYMSGYTDDAVFRHGFLEKGRVFLQKPFTPETLARKVREALGR